MNCENPSKIAVYEHEVAGFEEYLEGSYRNVVKIGKHFILHYMCHIGEEVDKNYGYVTPIKC